MATLTSPKASSPRSSNLSDLRGSVTPRFATEPLRDLDDPKASYGHAVIRFAARVLRAPLDPWQQWLVIHAGELDEDGLPRFRQVLTIVARQNGKSHLCRVLAAYWLFAEHRPTVLGVANKLSVARKQWLMTVRSARGIRALSSRIASVREANGQESLLTVDGCEYGVDAAGSNCGRGLTLSRIVWDERRQEIDLETDGALVPTMAAVENAQLWSISNMGTDRSLSLNDALAAGLAGTDATAGLFLWAASPDCDPSDPEAWAGANPNLGYAGRVLVSDMQAAAAKAIAAGGEALGQFKTERLCIRVTALDLAVDPGAWRRCLDRGSLDDQRDRLAAVVDVALDGLHATLGVAALLPDGRTRVEVVRSWEGRRCVDDAARDLPGMLERVGPRVVGWFPGGPAAALAPTMSRFPTVQAIKDLPAVCMPFAAAVEAGKVAHSGQRLLDLHVGAAERLRTGDRWTFSRRGAGGCDALYAVAGAASLVAGMPEPVRVRRVLYA